MLFKLKIYIASKLAHYINMYNNLECYKNCKAAPNVFVEGAKVFNFQNDNSKIIVGAGTKIRAELLIFANGGKIEIGENSYIGEYSRIWSAENVTIGNDVLISHNVNISDTNSHEINHLLRAESFKKMLREGHPKEKGEIITKAIAIEDNAWIGFNCIIHKGVTIGKGAIISAGSVVLKDVEPFTIVAGNPAQLIKKLRD